MKTRLVSSYTWCCNSNAAGNKGKWLSKTQTPEHEYSHLCRHPTGLLQCDQVLVLVLPRTKASQLHTFPLCLIHRTTQRQHCLANFLQDNLFLPEGLLKRLNHDKDLQVRAALWWSPAATSLLTASYSFQFCDSKWRFVAHWDKAEALDFNMGSNTETKWRCIQVCRKHLQELETNEKIMTARASENTVRWNINQIFHQGLIYQPVTSEQ